VTRSRISENDELTLFAEDADVLAPVLMTQPDLIDEVALLVENGVIIYVMGQDGSGKVYFNNTLSEDDVSKKLRVMAHQVVGSGEYVPPEPPKRRRGLRRKRID